MSRNTTIETIKIRPLIPFVPIPNTTLGNLRVFICGTYNQCGWTTDWQVFTKTFPNLTKLRIFDYGTLPAEFFHQIRNLTQLTNLRLGKVEESTIPLETVNSLPNLLRLRFDQPQDWLNDKFLGQITTQLTYLSCRLMQSMTEDGLKVLAQRCTNLKALEIDLCIHPYLTTGKEFEIFRNMIKLRIPPVPTSIPLSELHPRLQHFTSRDLTPTFEKNLLGFSCLTRLFLVKSELGVNGFVNILQTLKHLQRCYLYCKFTF